MYFMCTILHVVLLLRLCTVFPFKALRYGRGLRDRCRPAALQLFGPDGDVERALATGSESKDVFRPVDHWIDISEPR